MRIIRIDAACRQYLRNASCISEAFSAILPHTADELWSHLTFVEEQSVQLTDMPETIAVPNSEVTEEKFDRFMALRDDVLKALETARNEKLSVNLWKQT